MEVTPGKLETSRVAMEATRGLSEVTRATTEATPVLPEMTRATPVATKPTHRLPRSCSVAPPGRAGASSDMEPRERAAKARRRQGVAVKTRNSSGPVPDR